MRLPKRGERGFTLIELLIVVAILGVLAAVVIPNVQRFIGAGGEEARKTEFSTLQAAVHSMMVDNEIASIPNAIVWTGAATEAVNSMAAFPDKDSINTDPGGDGFLDKVNDPDGDAYDFAATPNPDQAGYLLYQHDIIADGGVTSPAALVNYVAMSTSTYYYTCEKDGTVRQWETADTTATGHEYTY